jgi:aldehyde dehydrogenase (NAD+)
MKLDKFYINGQWVDPVKDETINIINPANESVIGQLNVGNEQDIDKAVTAARKAFSNFSITSVNERLELLTEIRNIFKKRFDDIVDAITTEMGAPIKLSRGAQAAVGLGHLKTAIRVLENHKFEYEFNGSLIRHEPIGVCGLITPWNWPINQTISKLGPCLASGCTAILKPSEISPLSANVIAEIIHEAKAPAGVFNMVHGLGPIVGEALSSHQDVDMMSFTGSTRGGIAVAQASAKTVKRVSQELGGKSPNIILDDSAFESSVKIGVEKIMENTGQSCNAPTRMLVPKNRHQEAMQIAKLVAENLKTGDPKEETTDIGPLVSDVQYEKVQRLIESGINAGAKLVTGGTGRPSHLNKGYYVKPTVFGDVDNKMEIAQEEIFGPVLSIIPYDSEDEAVEIANDTDYGLSAYIAGENTERLKEIGRKIRAGQVHINYGSGGTNAPFGGFKQSGNGREKAEWGLEEFLETKAIMG